ncbi:MAG: hypothetical protein E7479_02530 [Ruminococcaceae bacterium]|nr:hypothetical protein [Oscillospiraceae bacterium]
MDMKIAGAGVIGGGEYDKVSISGSVKAEGFIRCKELHCSGAFSGNAEIECENEIKISGAFSNSGKIAAKEFRASGSAKTGAVSAEIIKVSGAFKAHGNLKATEISVGGGLITEGDIEAEKAEITGGINCGGLINAEELRVELSNSSGSKAENIGGSRIVIENYREKGIIERIFGRKTCGFVVSESIEGDEIIIEHTKAKTVTGKYVMIGEGCEIGLLQYSESVEISPKAKIGRCEKI